MRVVGELESRRSRIAWPTKPVAPVSRMCSFVRLLASVDFFAWGSSIGRLRDQVETVLAGQGVDLLVQVVHDIRGGREQATEEECGFLARLRRGADRPLARA